MPQSLADLGPAMKDAYLEDEERDRKKGKKKAPKRKHSKPPAFGYNELREKLKDKKRSKRGD